jgi:formylglycine-generating enzyme required for sulfatase activity
MIFVAATTLRLGQPEGGRGGWPPPTDPILPVDVAAFCVDPGPRTRAQVHAALGLDALPNRADCRPTEDVARPGQPATCVSQAEAASACAAMVPGGRLPGLTEWEALARSSSPPAASWVEREWAADPFPAALLRRGKSLAGEGMFRQDLPPESRVKARAQGDMLHSWNRQKSTTRLPMLGFRCAVDPLPDPG